MCEPKGDYYHGAFARIAALEEKVEMLEKFLNIESKLVEVYTPSKTEKKYVIKS